MRRQAAILIAILALVSFGGGSADARQLVAWSGDEEPGSIVIETSARRLYYVIGAGEAIGYDIAVGRPGAEWFGETNVVRKAERPTWYPTAGMRKSNPRLPVSVGPGPSNPLGVRAIYLEHGVLRIHGTNAPDSIGYAASSGCFRMMNADVEHLFDLVDVGASVSVRD